MLSLGIATSCRHPEPQLESLCYDGGVMDGNSSARKRGKENLLQGEDGGISDWSTRAGLRLFSSSREWRVKPFDEEECLNFFGVENVSH